MIEAWWDTDHDPNPPYTLDFKKKCHATTKKCSPKSAKSARHYFLEWNLQRFAAIWLAIFGRP